MPRYRSRKSSKGSDAGRHEGHLPKQISAPKKNRTQAQLLALQRAVGNEAVNQMLGARRVGAPPDAETWGLPISRPDGPEEREARRVADDLQRSSDSDRRSDHTGRSGMTPESSDDREHPEPPQGSRSHPLSEADRAFFEASLGRDLSNVRVHRDSQAAEAADQLNARAFTLGNDIVFGRGEYDPASVNGKQLLAHELAHVVQQGEVGGAHADGAAGGPVIMRSPKDPEEKKGLSKAPEEPQSLSLSSVPKPFVLPTRLGVVATVYFDQNRFLLDPANFEAVQKLSEQLRFMADPLVVVDGHASKEGTDEFNIELSKKRRELVVALLRSKLTDKVSFGGEARGESQPVAEETAEDKAELEKQRARNRRVEINIVSSSALREKEPPVPTPDADEEFKRPTTVVPPPRYVPPPETEEERIKRRLDQMMKLPPTEELKKRQKISLAGALGKKFDGFMDDVLRTFKVPPKHRGLVKKGARALVEKGVEALIDEGLDQAGLGDTEKKAIKKAIEAGAKTEFEF